MKILTLGECLARLSSLSGERLSHSTQLNLTFGGAESNVAINLSQLGHETAHATKVPNNLLTQNLIHILKSYDVDTSHFLFGGNRLGTYYLETGSDLRASKVIYDRAYSSMAMMNDLEWDLDDLFKDIDLLHITGITLALSDEWAAIGTQIIKEAHKRNIKVSFDMNYRSALWSVEKARDVYQEVLPYLSYLSATNRDATAFLGIEEDDSKTFDGYIEAIANKYKNLEYIFGSKRVNNTANSYTYQGFIYSNEKITYSDSYEISYSVDRVGAGDSYTAGILDGIIHQTNSLKIVNFATAAAVLKHTVHGDINQFNRDEIVQFMSNDANILR